MSGPFRDLLNLDPNGEVANPVVSPEQRAARARALAQAGVTPVPKPASPATTSDGQGFWDQLKAGAASNTEKFLNFVNNKPMPEEPAAPTTLAGKAGRFVSGIADPVNLIGYGATAGALDALGVPKMIETGAAKLAGESLASKLAAKTVAASAEGAAVGGLGSPPTDYLRSVEENTPYDPSSIPGSMLQGAAMGAVLDPFMRGALEVPGLAKAGVEHMVSGGISSYPHEIPEHATWENYDPWDSHTPTQSVPGAGQVNSGMAGAYEPGKLFVQGVLKKFGDKMDVGVPTDDSGRHGVAVDLYKSGTKDDPTLSVGFLRHNEDAPIVELKSGRDDAAQPQPTPRETMAILRHIRQVLIDDPKIKWLDTQPTNSSVESFLSKYGGRYEDGGQRLVVPADNIRQGLRGLPHPETAQFQSSMAESHADFEKSIGQLNPDPFGRLERAIRKGKDPDEHFYGGTWEHRNDTASGANPRDPDTGLLAYSGVPVPAIAKAGKGFTEGVKGALGDKLDGEPKEDLPPTSSERPVLNVAKLPIAAEAKTRLDAEAEKLRGLKNSETTTVQSQVEEAARLALELRKNVNGNETLDLEKARLLSGTELRARTEANIKINADIEDLTRQMETASPDRQEALQEQIGQLHDAQTHLLSESVVGEGQKGRDLRALRYAPDSLVGWQKKAQAAVGPGNKIPEAIDTEIRRLVNARKGAKDPKAQADVDEQLESLMTQLQKRPYWDHVYDLYKTLLTFPGTTDAGVLGANITATVADHANRIAATVFDQVISLFTNQRTMAYRGLAGSPMGLRSAGENIKENFRTGKSALADTQFGKPVGEQYGLAQKIVAGLPGQHLELAEKALKLDTMTKTYLKMHWARLGAEHMAFRDVLIAQNLVGEAHVKAINEGLKGEARNARVVEILKDPTQHPALVARAIEDATRAVYVKKNQFSAMVNAARQTAPRGVKQVLDLAMPFTKIAANIAEAGLDYTPVVGLLKEATSKSKDQHSIVMALGRQVTGGGLVAVAYALHKQGILTGAGPKSTAEKQQWESEGRAPYSVLVNGTWRSYERVLGPLSWPIGLGSDWADFVDNLSKTGPHTELMDKVNNLISGPAEHLADEVPGGAMSVFSSFKAANPGENFLEQTAVSALTPAPLANLAKGLDNRERATDTFADKLQARIPGLRESLPAKVDATGREIPTADDLAGTLVDPTRPHVAVDDPALNELSRLGVNFAKPGTTGTYTPLEQQQRFQAGLTPNHIPERFDRSPADVRGISQETINGRRIIDYLNDRVADPAYQGMPDEIKRAILTDLISKLRAGSTAMYEQAHPQPLKDPVRWP